jgi:hypothetical protein
MAVANAMTSIGADKVRNKASLLTADRFLMTEMIAHIRLIDHSIVPGEESHEEGLGGPAGAVRPIHRRRMNIDEHPIVPDSRLLHL